MPVTSSLGDVFRFVLVRPPAEVPEGGAVPLDEQTEFIAQARAAASEPNAQEQLAQLATAFVATERFVETEAALPYRAQLETLSERLAERYATAGDSPGDDDDDAGERGKVRGDRRHGGGDTKPPPRKTFAQVVTEIFNATPEALIQTEQFRGAEGVVADSVVALTYAPGLFRHAGTLADAMRLLNAVRRAGEGDEAVRRGDGDVIRALLRAPLVLPWSPRPIGGNNGSGDLAERVGSRDGGRGAAAVRERLVRVRQAIEDLMRADRNGLVHYPDLVQPGTNGSGLPEGHDDAPRPGAPIAVEDLGTTPLALTRAGRRAISADTLALLEELHVDPAKTPVPQAVTLLHESITSFVEPDETAPTGVVVRYGHAIRELIAESETQAELVAEPRRRELAYGMPATAGQVKPAGIGELLVVRQQLKRYEGGEVGHIENVLKGEGKKREHRRLERAEESLLIETETIEEEERETSTTERFELQREASRTISSDASLEAGARVSGRYGPAVEFSASLELSLSTSSTETTRSAASYAKDVTDRSVRRLSERIREERTQRLLREVEELNVHQIENTSGSGHISGVYQWLEKVYEAQVFSYGTRLMFDFTVPEPAAFFVHALTDSAVTPDLPSPPEPFTATPAAIDEHSYGTYVARYGATGVTPPPEPYVTVAKVFEERSDQGANTLFTKAAEVAIPPGYHATSAFAYGTWTQFEGWWLNYQVGSAWGRGFLSLGGEVGQIPVVLNSGRINALAASVKINCQRTTAHYNAWRLKTFEAIQQAYQQRRREYEEALAAARARAAAIEMPGGSPARNRIVERTELKKSCISLLTGDRYDTIGSVLPPEPGRPYPEIDFDDAAQEGSYIRFLEHAFEWEQMTYLFYPYFWGRKPHWISRLLADDADPQFAEFLKAGSARVTLPVRPGFEDAVLRFLQTGQIWNGIGQPPAVGDPLYVPLWKELAERTGEFDDERPVGSPWDVRIPTNLVRLRPDNALPSWQRGNDGTWTPA